MKSTLFNMVAVLFCITLVASAGVGGVYQLTAEPIAAANAAAVTEALRQVLPPFEETSEEELLLDEMPIRVYTARESGNVVGYAVKSMTKSGFGGAISMMVGFDPTGKILNVNVLSQAETPGLGTKMAEPENVLLRSVQGKNPAEMNLKVKKDGGDVDALTAATISSRAYVDAVARAYNAYVTVVGTGTTLDGHSGATQPADATQNQCADTVQEGGENE